jgi:hypothetical protein
MVLLEGVAALSREVVTRVEVTVDINSCLMIVSYNVDSVSRAV